MENPSDTEETLRFEMANRLFFRLYQCANMLHKTGSRAVEAEGLTTQQWAVLGALSRSDAAQGMSVAELARYLMLSRQNLAGVVGRMERDGHLLVTADPSDRRSRRVTMSQAGRTIWETQAQPKIRDYYGLALDGFSVKDMVHVLHYLLLMLDNMKRIDQPDSADEDLQLVESFLRQEVTP
ncbi:MAG: MarR family transcriptional regulator [Betaproteobacteria bacterium]|jgi:DNA-binding MarR family transcriptional regulator|nr:MarR family transcriptional regulator [Betaproteobacteria bacterium]NBP45386.1 MarR family transcriptional regulator [Betaproteobacteria bacterium]